MLKRISILCVALLLALFYSFTGHHKESVDFSRAERRMLHIPTAGLFGNSNYFTVTPSDLRRDGWCFPVEDGVVFTPEFRHEPVGWYIMSAEARHEVRAAMQGVVRLVRKTDLGRTVVILHPNGLETVYAHQAKTLVRSGDYVSAGQPVALAEADHGAVYTYFTMMVNGVPLSPSTLAREDGTLKPDWVRFTVDGGGTVRATQHRPGTVAERSPRFEWMKAQELVDLDRPLTAMERQHVGVATPGLFENTSVITIDLGRVGDWSYPLPGAKVISPYGGKRRNHTGTDLKTRPKDKIRAVFDGVVRFSGKYSAYGNMVVVRHANGLETCYSHNARNLVKVGDRVKAGEAIATVGRTGRATTEHCHFEVRVNGVPFNSDYVFDHASHTLRNDKLTFRRKANGTISIKAE